MIDGQRPVELAHVSIPPNLRNTSASWRRPSSRSRSASTTRSATRRSLPGTGAPGGIAFQFRDVTTLKGDPCHWSGTDDDIPVGPTVDDLVQALQDQTAYEASDPVDVVIGGYAGQRVDIVSPTDLDTLSPGCDESVWRPWDGEIYAQGPANRWQTNILDVDGTRFVIVVQDFPGTNAADRAELDAIVDSMVIAP